MSLREISIGELVNKCKTWNPQKSEKTTFDYIDLSSVDKDLKAIVSTERIQCSDAPSRARQLVEKDDILISTVRPNLNGVAQVKDNHVGMTASTGYCILRPKPEKLDSNYLFQWVKTESFIKKMVDVAIGANYPAVSDSKVKESTIPLPPLPEQKRIAAILDAADALRTQRRQSIAELDLLLQSTFLEMFGDPVENPKGWNGMELGKITSIDAPMIDPMKKEYSGTLWAR
jgi:Restriction endonuclease S subunits